MSRRKTDLRISLSGFAGQTVRLNLSLDPFGNWFVYRDGALSKSHPRASSTVVAKQIQKWLIGQATQVEKRRRDSQKVSDSSCNPNPVG